MIIVLGFYILRLEYIERAFHPRLELRILVALWMYILLMDFLFHYVAVLPPNRMRSSTILQPSIEKLNILK
jgi:hypothetical protein